MSFAFKSNHRKLFSQSLACFRQSPVKLIMPNSKRLLEIVKRWQKLAALGRRRIMLTRTSSSNPQSENNWSPIIANSGHLFVYSTDRKRFMIPVAYLSHNLFRELFRLSEEEFGLPSDGPITLPCDASCMEYIISVFQHGASKDVERALLTFIAGNRCSTSHLPHQLDDLQQRVVYGF